MGAALVRGEACRMIDGFLLLGVFVGGNALIGIAEHAPNNAHARDLGGTRTRLGLCLRLGRSFRFFP